MVLVLVFFVAKFYADDDGVIADVIVVFLFSTVIGLKCQHEIDCNGP